MNSLEHQHSTAMMEFLQRTSFPIWARNSSATTDWFVQGTGAWFRVPQRDGKTRLFLLTAGHVLLPDGKQIHPELYVPTTRPTVVSSSATVRLVDVDLKTYAARGDRTADTERMDTAIVEVLDRRIVDDVLEGGWEVLDASNFGPHAASAGVDGVGYMISGYPQMMAGPMHGGVVGAPITMLLDRYDGEFSFSDGGFDPDLDLLLNRPDRDLASGRTVAPFELNGVSGALTWALRSWNVQGIWDPRRGAVVVGHQIQATKTGYVRARRGVALARLLQRAAPEIATEIEARLEGRITS
jgi:hypothetical protein